MLWEQPSSSKKDTVKNIPVGSRNVYIEMESGIDYDLSLLDDENEPLSLFASRDKVCENRSNL